METTIWTLGDFTRVARLSGFGAGKIRRVASSARSANRAVVAACGGAGHENLWAKVWDVAGQRELATFLDAGFTRWLSRSAPAPCRVAVGPTIFYSELWQGGE